MTTRSFAVRGGGRIAIGGSRRSGSSFAVQVGSQVVAVSALARVGTNSARGTSWLPPARIPIGTASVTMPDGTTQTLQVLIDPQWYRWADEISNRRLGGVEGQSLADVASNASAAIVAVTSVSQQVASVAQDIGAVQDAADATRQVLVASDVPGSDQIPPVRYGPNTIVE